MTAPTIFIVSGGLGTSGEQVTRTALAQFAGNNAPIIIVPHVQHTSEIDTIIDQAAAAQGLIVHTLVNADLRERLISQAHHYNVPAIDLIGPLLLQLTRLFGQRPAGEPGLYRQLREDYFKRIDAIEFAVAHDDGQRPHELQRAEIVLAGVSRVGKTPLAMYLSTQGWKTANVPLIQHIEPPAELFLIDPRRVVGLDINPEQLVAYRRRRQHTLGLSNRPGYASSPYTAPENVHEEVAFARDLFRRGGFTVIDITDRPIEESASAAIARVTERLRG